MLNIPTPIPKQVLLRLPNDLAAKLARSVPPRKRNQYLVDLIRQDLAKEDDELVAACEALNRWEANHPKEEKQTQEWIDAVLTEEDKSDFDKATFERDFAIAQTQIHSIQSNNKAIR